MCTGANVGSFNPGVGPTQNVVNPRKNINSNEAGWRNDILGLQDASHAAKALAGGQAEEDTPVADVTTPPDNRGIAVQRRKPRSLLSAAGGVGDTSVASTGAMMAKAVLGG